jgi:putative effector of murein hydrolase LrgA (UPF0299 family)
VITAAVAPVAVAPAIVELAIIFLALALIMLRRAWVSTFGHLLRTLASPFRSANVSFKVLGHGVTIGFGWVADLLEGVDRSALHLLGAGIQATEWAANRLWQLLAYFVHETGRVLGDLAEAQYHALQILWRQSIPGLILAHLHPLASKVEWLIHRLAHLDVNPTTIIHRTVKVLDPRVAALERDLAHLQRVVAASGAAVLAPPTAIPVPGLGGIEHGIDAVRSRLGKLARALSPAAIAGLVASALVGLRLGWLKCSKVERTAKHLCGMDEDVLAGLLAGTAVIFGTVSLVEFARAMQDDATREFWRA